ncbi:hypothetical protein MMC30_006069 [Trapelia coarctata]|nr:hypothetical protein [Trapelia coarctata]
MPSHSVSHYPLPAQDLSTSDQPFDLHLSLSQKFESNYLSVDRMVSRPGTDATSYYSPDEHSQPSALAASLSESQWTGAQDTSPALYEPYQPFSNQYFTHLSDPTWCRRSNGKALQLSYGDRGSLQDPGLLYSSLTCPRRFPQEVNDAVKAAMGSLEQKSSPTQPPMSSAYLLDSIERTQDPSLPSPRYSPFSSEIPASQVDMSGLYPLYESFQGHSPTLSQSVHYSGLPESYVAVSPDVHNSHEPFDTTTPAIDEDTDGGLTSEPYAQLIYRALKSVPSHRMVLKEIYEWFEKNTDKAKNNSSKGWQNSIRHNLSMNGAFKKVDQNPPSDDGKKGFVWVLEQSALENGVESTTRYRKLGSNKKSSRVEPVAAQRQRSGAKGGKATKKSAKLRRTTRSEQPQRRELEEASQDQIPASMRYQDHQSLLDNDPYEMDTLPYPAHTPPLTVQSSIAETSPYGFEDIAGCVPSLDNEPLFYDSSEQDGMDQTLSTQHRLFCDGEYHSMRGCEFDLKSWD